MLGQNTGDYVFTAGGLDNVITMVCMLAVVAVSFGYLHTHSFQWILVKNNIKLSKCRTH